METISILYCASEDPIEAQEVKQLSEKIRHAICIKQCSSNSLLPELRLNPNYSFIILHLSVENVYTLADACRNLTDAILVAESSVCPVGEKEVLEHFDCYYRLFGGARLERLFKQYGFVRDEDRN